VTTSETKITKLKADAETNELIKSRTKTLDALTGETLDELDIKTYQEIGSHNERAYITKAEMKTIKAWDKNPGVTLLGFHDRSWLQPHYNVHSPYFIYPDEEAMQGSTVAFVALYRSLLKKDKIAIARFTPRNNSSPKLVALMPQVEEFDAEGEQTQAPGFNVVVLPWANDIRDVQLDVKTQPLTQTPPAEEAVTKAEILVGTLTADRAQTQSYHNPVLQKSYEQLQSMALYSTNEWEAAGGDAVRDTLNPDKAMLGEIEPYIADFFSALPTETTTPKAPKRKKVDDDGDGGTAKKAKSDDVGKSAALNWTDLAAKGLIGKQTVGVLKAYCKENGLGVSGKKGDLVERVEEHLASYM